jgi:hypothetical protein
MKLEALLAAADEAVEHESDFHARCENEEPSWLGNLKAAIAAVRA